MTHRSGSVRFKKLQKINMSSQDCLSLSRPFLCDSVELRFILKYAAALLFLSLSVVKLLHFPSLLTFSAQFHVCFLCLCFEVCLCVTHSAWQCAALLLLRVAALSRFLPPSTPRCPLYNIYSSNTEIYPTLFIKRRDSWWQIIET